MPTRQPVLIQSPHHQRMKLSEVNPTLHLSYFKVMIVEDPETSTPFPLSLNLLTPTPPLTLIGLGVRKVSFLRVKVYSAGFYLEESALRGLDNIEGWHVRQYFS